MSADPVSSSPREAITSTFCRLTKIGLDVSGFVKFRALAIILTSALMTAVGACGPEAAPQEEVPGQSATPVSSAADGALEALMENFWNEKSADEPLASNAFGDFVHMDQLDSLSEAAFEKSRKRFDDAIAELKEIDRRALAPENQTNRDVFEWVLTNERSLLDLKTRYIPLSSIFSWQTTFMQIVAITPFSKQKDYEDYIARLSKFGRYADEAMALMREGIETGYVLPCDSMRDYDQIIQASIAEKAQESFAYKPVEKIPERFDAKFAASVQARVVGEIDKTVTPALKRYLDFYRSEYRPACRKTYGLGALDGGAEAYATIVRYFATTPDATPETVHQLGLSEVERIHGEMKKIRNEVGFDGDLQAFFAFMRTNPDFYVDNEEDYLAQVALIAKKIDRQTPTYFAYLPRNRFAVTPIPAAQAPTSAAAYYQPGSLARGIAGQYFINLHDIGTRSLNDLPALGLHEAEPGHHLQLSIQQELGDLPRFRRSYYISAFGEGWGLYSEYLGEEMGIYETPYERFSRLTYEIWRACRLVVDTGIHAKGWSRQQAIDYMADNSALGLPNIANEVDRYITMPGQAISYKLGELKIKELRARAEAELGEVFSIRDFHTHLLTGGAVPLAVLESRMTDWIEVQKNPTDRQSER